MQMKENWHQVSEGGGGVKTTNATSTSRKLARKYEILIQASPEAKLTSSTVYLHDLQPLDHNLDLTATFSPTACYHFHMHTSTQLSHP